MPPAPLAPLFSTAKTAWGQVADVMSWFSKIVTTLYGYSDGIIKLRQNKVNTQYKIKKAEKEAYRIMKEQEKKNKLGNSNGQGNKQEKRGMVNSGLNAQSFKL
jgi:hypothetical protein